MKIAFDSTVLLKAFRHDSGLRVVGDDTDENERCARALEDAPMVIVCPIAWLEVTRFAKAEELPNIRKLEQRKRMEPIDDDVVAKAHALMRKRIQNGMSRRARSAVTRRMRSSAQAANCFSPKRVASRIT